MSLLKITLDDFCSLNDKIPLQFDDIAQGYIEDVFQGKDELNSDENHSWKMQVLKDPGLILSRFLKPEIWYQKKTHIFS